MTTHDDLERSLGRVEGNQQATRERMDRFEKLVSDGFSDVGDALNEIKSRLGQIEARENERKGAWMVLVGIASVVSSVLTGGFIAWIKGWLS